MKTQNRSLSDANATTYGGEWGKMWTLASADIGNSDKLTLGRVIIKKGGSNPRHSHPTCQEILHLLRGKLLYYVQDECIEVNPGDTLSIEAGVPHYGESVGDEDAEMIVAFSNGVRDFKEEPLS